MMALIARDLRLIARAPGDWLMALAFFAMVVAIAPLALGPEPELLRRISAGMVWIGALLSLLLTMDRLMRADHQSGMIDLVVAQQGSLIGYLVAKCVTALVSTLLPLIICSPVLGIMLGLPVWPEAGLLSLSLLLGAPGLTGLGVMGAALTLGARRGAVLLVLILLPLTIPLVIFATSGLDAALTGLDPWPHFKLLAGLSLGLGVTAPLAALGALKLAIEE
ncbi:MAG: heme exporter protein CcmB [Alphaproteobacteria bacterium]